MNSFREFSENMLKAVFEEDRRAHDFVDLSTIPQKYRFAGDREWVQDWAEAHSGYLKFEQGSIASPPHPLMARISGGGRLHVESAYGDNDGVPPFFPDATQNTGIIADAATSLTTSDEPTITAHLPLALSSEAWTGIEIRTQRDPAIVETLRQKVHEIEAVSLKLSLTNSERQKISAITEALVKLIESPEPEWKAIVALLQSPKLSAILSLAQLAQFALKILFGIG